MGCSNDWWKNLDTGTKKAIKGFVGCVVAAAITAAITAGITIGIQLSQNGAANVVINNHSSNVVNNYYNYGVQAQMTVNQPFLLIFTDIASNESKSFISIFCFSVINNVKVQGTAPYYCSVTNLSNGSVIIQFSLNFAGVTVRVSGETMRTAIMDAMDGIRNDTNWNISSPNVMVERVDEKQTADMFPTFTSMPITSSPTTTTTPTNTRSPTNTTTPTTTSSPTVSRVVTTPDPFKCVVGGPYLIPASDTYPNNCGKYQQCLNGVAYPFSCSSDRHVVVNNGSVSCKSAGDPNTYCYKLNAAKQTTTTPTI